MPSVPIVMPQLGESIAEATIVRILVTPGQSVEAEEEILEVETTKAVMGVTTPCAGTVLSLGIEVGQTCPIGAVLGYISSEVEADGAFSPSLLGLNGQHGGPPSAVPTISPAAQPADPVPYAKPPPSAGAFSSPRVRALLDDAGLHPSELELISGTGKDGRVTAEDVERHVASLDRLSGQDCSPLRLGVADAMRRSWSRPLATVGAALNLEPILAHRKTSGVGPALYAVRALGLALGETPALAARFFGSRLMLPASIDIGVAVEVEDGVVVPVLRGVDQTDLGTLAETYRPLVIAAKSRRIPPENQGGAIASVTNYGPLGITWGTPIPQPTETLIVGLGRAELRPCWDEARDAFRPRREAELTVTFDHRAMDGAASGRLLNRLLTLLQNPASL